MEESIDWHGRARWLVLILIISGTFNVGLIATLGYFAIRDKQTFKNYDLRPIETHYGRASLSRTNEEELASLSLYSFDDLVRTLSDATPVEEGYTRRDLALTWLVSTHYFDIERALPYLDITPKQAVFTGECGEPLTLYFYPNLSNDSFSVLRHFAKKEKFPITTRGLYERLLVTPTQPIKKALMRTFPYQAIEATFARTGDAIDSEKIFELILEGGWNTLQTASEIVRTAAQIDLETKRHILTLYLSSGSALAAEILLTQDFTYAVKRLTNPQMKMLVDLVPETSPHRKTLLSALENSLRPDTLITQQTSTLRTHTIQDGDTLWEISRQYKISLNDLKVANNIESEYALQPGTELIIP